MNQLHTLLFLSNKHIEIVESILKNSDYSYEFFNNKNKSDIIIIDYIILEENISLNLSNFEKVICIIPKGYLNFIKKEVSSFNIIFIEFPITYSKLIKHLQENKKRP